MPRRTVLLAARGLEAVTGLTEAALRALGPAASWTRQSAGLEVVGHRPWPLPRRPWLMGQTWERLLFAHWRIEPDRLRRVIPAELTPDTHDGAAWIGVTPFEITGLRLRGTPPPPLLSRFPELNLRTYVTVAGRPGIHFFSLDAGSRAAVAAARSAYRLPYAYARMSVRARDDRTRYESRRERGLAAFAGEYGPSGPEFTARPGTLEHFLAERYCLYVVDEHRRILRGDIHHPPWPLQPATCGLSENTVASAAGITLPDEAPLLHYCRRQDMVAWPLAPAG